MNDVTSRHTHWSFWVIGVVAVLWHVLGGINFLMQLLPGMVAQMPETVRAVVESRPLWATVAFAVAVFGGTIAALLLLLRQSIAVYFFVAALLGAIGTQVPLLIGRFPLETVAGGLLQIGFGALLVWYAKWAEGKGWLSTQPE